MKTDNVTRSTVREIAAYVLTYALWLITIIMSVLAVLEIRQAVNAIWVIMGVDSYSIALVNQVCLLLCGFAAFIYVMWLEHDYREGVRLRLSPRLDDKARSLPPSGILQRLAELGLDLMLRRFAITFAIPLCLYLLSLAVYEITLNAI